MKLGKDIRRVVIVFNDGSHVGGVIHVAEGKRVLDFFNDQKKNFIALTEVEGRDKGFLILNKSSIKWIEEL